MNDIFGLITFVCLKKIKQMQKELLFVFICLLYQMYILSHISIYHTL